MSNVWSELEKQRVIAWGRLGWSLRRIQQELGVRREPASTSLKAEGITVQPPGRRRAERAAKQAITANQVTTDSDAAKPAIAVNQVTTDSGDSQTVPPATVSGGNRSPSASSCEPFREAIELGLSQGRNAMGIWQDLISQTGFSVGANHATRLARTHPRRVRPPTCAPT